MFESRESHLDPSKGLSPRCTYRLTEDESNHQRHLGVRMLKLDNLVGQPTACEQKQRSSYSENPID